MTSKRPSFGRGAGAGRRTVRVAGHELVRSAPLDATADRAFPLVLEPAPAAAASGFDPVSWAREHRPWLDQRLVEHGALLLRGFGVDSVERFETLVEAAAGSPLSYTERSSPRSQVAGNIYTSTDHPPEREIFLHNEQSYNRVFPRKIAFCCLVEPATQGATPIADSRRVLARLDPAVVRRFAEQGYLYVRNFGAGLGLSWQTAFQTDDREAVEEYGRANEIEIEWLDGGRLRTSQRRPALARHPVSGELTWFNHAAFFHVSSLEPDVREQLTATFAERDLPNNTYWGDGTGFEPEVTAALQDAYRHETVRFDWRAGDVLLLDNMLVAHGREPFTGPRKVVVSMAEPTSWESVAAGVDAAQPVAAAAEEAR